jgi:hypothetical protein
MDTDGRPRWSFRMKTWLQEWADPLLLRVAGVLDRAGLTPIALTLVGLVVSACHALSLTTGRTAVAGWVLLVAGMVNSLNGPLARVQGRISRFGSFLDSTVDQWVRRCDGLSRPALALAEERVARRSRPHLRGRHQLAARQLHACLRRVDGLRVPGGPCGPARASTHRGDCFNIWAGFPVPLVCRNIRDLHRPAAPTLRLEAAAARFRYAS